MKPFLVLSFLLFSFGSHSQDLAKKDSLLNLFEKSNDDSLRIMLLLRVAVVYEQVQFDSAISYLNKAANFAKKSGNSTCDSYINNQYFVVHYYNHDFREAVEYVKRNLAIGEAKKDDKLLARAYNNLASGYNSMGNYKSAIEYSLKSLELTEKIKDSAGFALRNLTVSNTYFNLKQFEKTIYYAKRAVEFGKQFNIPFAQLMGRNNIGAAYAGLHKIDSAIFMQRELLDMAIAAKDDITTYYALHNLCLNNFKKGNLPELEKYWNMLNDLRPRLVDKRSISNLYNISALRHMMRREFPEAKLQLDSGIAYTIKEEGDALPNFFESYSKFYFLQGKIKEAEDYVHKTDSLQTDRNLKELNFYIEDLSLQYETEKKESQLQLQVVELRQKSNLIYFLAAGVFALLLISVLAYRSYSHKQKLQQAKIDELETEKLLTATEAVLKGEEQERSRLAKDLHDGLGGMLSGIKHSLSSMKENLIMTPENAQAFERSIDMLNASINEMRRVAHNMMPEILVKYGLNTALKEFCAEMSASGVASVNYQALDMETLQIGQTASVSIYRIAQELVNNAFKHGNAKEVLVQLHYHQQEKLLALTVEDDGVGFSVDTLEKAKGIGWKNIQNRVDFLKGKLDVQSAPGTGCSVMIEINT